MPYTPLPAFARVFPPVPGRAQLALIISCPICRGTHLGRARTVADAAGPRRVPCGTVDVIVQAAAELRRAA